jgi:hypothetical protein
MRAAVAAAAHRPRRRPLPSWATSATLIPGMAFSSPLPFPLPSHPSPPPGFSIQISNPSSAAECASSERSVRMRQGPRCSTLLTGGGGGGYASAVRSFQYALSLRLAREHPEITERLAEEMMQRNLQDRQLTARQQFLMCMRPWFHNLSFVKLRESDVIARLLQSLYYVTLRNNDAHPAVMETLWSTIASKARTSHFARGCVCVTCAAP